MSKACGSVTNLQPYVPRTYGRWAELVTHKKGEMGREREGDFVAFSRLLWIAVNKPKSIRGRLSRCSWPVFVCM